MEHNSSLVNLSIPQSVTAPIVAAKVQEAVMAALGGADAIVASVVKQICETKVDENGKPSSYSSDQNRSWMDFHVTKILQGAINEELKRQTVELTAPVKDALIKQLQTKSGASKIATALLGALDGNNELVLSFITKEQQRKSKKEHNWL